MCDGKFAATCQLTQRTLAVEKSAPEEHLHGLPGDSQDSCRFSPITNRSTAGVPWVHGFWFARSRQPVAKIRTPPQGRRNLNRELLLHPAQPLQQVQFRLQAARLPSRLGSLRQATIIFVQTLDFGKAALRTAADIDATLAGVYAIRHQESLVLPGSSFDRSSGTSSRQRT